MRGTYVKLVYSLAKSNTHQIGSYVAVIFDHGRKYDWLHETNYKIIQNVRARARHFKYLGR